MEKTTQKITQEQMEHRLEELKSEHQKGVQQLTELDEKGRSLKDTLLRISGAIQVLEEMIAPSKQKIKEPEDFTANFKPGREIEVLEDEDALHSTTQ